MTLSLKQVKDRFSQRQWTLEDNEKLLNIVSEDRLNIEPATLYGLDQLGLNHLEIINLAHCVGKRFIDLSTSDIDFLNFIQDKYSCVFNFEEKQNYQDKTKKTHPMRTMLSGYVSNKSGDHWLRSSALLLLSDNYN